MHTVQWRCCPALAIDLACLVLGKLGPRTDACEKNPRFSRIYANGSMFCRDVMRKMRLPVVRVFVRVVRSCRLRVDVDAVAGW